MQQDGYPVGYKFVYLVALRDTGHVGQLQPGEPVCPPGQPQPGATEPERTQVPADLKLGERWSDLLRGPIGNYEPRIIGIVLNAWASLQGYLVAEVLGNLPILIDDIDSLCRAHVRTVMLEWGSTGS